MDFNPRIEDIQNCLLVLQNQTFEVRAEVKMYISYMDDLNTQIQVNQFKTNRIEINPSWPPGDTIWQGEGVNMPPPPFSRKLDFFSISIDGI